MTGTVFQHVLQRHREVLGRRSKRDTYHLQAPGPDRSTEAAEPSVHSQASVRARGHLMERNILCFRRGKGRFSSGRKSEGEYPMDAPTKGG